MEIRGLSSEAIDSYVALFANRLHKALKTTLSHVSISLTHALVSAGDPEPSYAPMDSIAAIQTLWNSELSDLNDELSVIFVASTKKIAYESGVGSQLEAPDPLGGYAQNVLARSMAHVRAFSAEVYDTAKKQVTLAMQDGLSIDETAQLIENVAEIKFAKAKTIAQTAVIGAVNGGEWAQMLQLAKQFDTVVTKTWEATEDSHTRPTHAAADGQTVALEEKFHVGGSFLNYPGDPLGTPAEIVNCRCTQLFDADVEDGIESPQTSSGDQTGQSAVVAMGQLDTDLTAAVNAEFNALHPRGKDGKFITKGTGLPDKVLEVLVSIRGGHTYGDFKNSDVESFLGYANQITPAQWHNLKPEDQKHITDFVDSAMEEGVPGSAHAGVHLEDIAAVEPDIQPHEDVFNPATQLPTGQHGTQATKKVEEIKPTHTATPF